MVKARQFSPPNSRQRGSTLLGIVLGLIIGLAIAIMLALYIRESPRPFISKGNALPITSKREESGTTFDPNRALVGYSSSQTAPPVLTESGDGTLHATTKNPLTSKVSTGYFLQIGTYRVKQDAEQQRARLALQGFESKITQHNTSVMVYYRVRIGPFVLLEDLNSTRKKLFNNGINSIVIRFMKK
ncbi:SPOR domain-containing protein [Candidatus Vallotia cooleyia]|uniref:SPOR domain-containing protein n=1 Tax=Candidatus Vallotiella adelgis TaxID=1177211 RepID=UPI001D018756|nr:SPOR domain-containing protein [Candidatus Vallotia cooleyia]